MRKIILITFTLLMFSVSASAQSECKQNGGTKDCVLVQQSFVDLANQIAKESIAKDKVIQDKNDVIKAKNETIIAKNIALEAKDELIKAKDERIDRLVEIKCSVTSFKPFGWSIIKKKKCY